VSPGVDAEMNCRALVEKTESLLSLLFASIHLLPPYRFALLIQVVLGDSNAISHRLLRWGFSIVRHEIGQHFPEMGYHAACVVCVVCVRVMS
jgi:hypothetical protein